MERAVLQRFGGSARGRIGARTALKALGVLARRHPGAIVDMAGAAALEAGRAGWAEAKGRAVSLWRRPNRNRGSTR